jgi:hypothetical protein
VEHCSHEVLWLIITFQKSYHEGHTLTHGHNQSLPQYLESNTSEQNPSSEIDGRLNVLEIRHLTSNSNMHYRINKSPSRDLQTADCSPQLLNVRIFKDQLYRTVYAYFYLVVSCLQDILLKFCSIFAMRATYPAHFVVLYLIHH